MKQKKSSSDELLLQWNSFLCGNRDAFGRIYEMTILDLYSFGKTLTADDELVKDCIQNIFIRLYRNRAQLASVENVKVYLLIALKNTVINAFKKQQVYQKFLETYSVEEQGDLLDESEEDRIIAQETNETAQKALTRYQSALTTRQQEIIHYRFVDELTIEEIASLLKINYQSVANTIQRSLKKIRKIYLKNGV